MSGRKKPSAARDRRLRLALGREVKRRRLAQGHTWPQLAARSGLSPNYIGSVEHGRRDVSLSTVLKLAKGLGVVPCELFGTEDHSPAALEAACLFDALDNPARRRAVKELLRVTSRPASRHKTKRSAKSKRGK